MGKGQGKVHLTHKQGMYRMDHKDRRRDRDNHTLFHHSNSNPSSLPWSANGHIPTNTNPSATFPYHIPAYLSHLSNPLDIPPPTHPLTIHHMSMSTFHPTAVTSPHRKDQDRTVSPSSSTFTHPRTCNQDMGTIPFLIQYIQVQLVDIMSQQILRIILITVQEW